MKKAENRTEVVRPCVFYFLFNKVSFSKSFQYENKKKWEQRGTTAKTRFVLNFNFEMRGNAGR